LILVTRELHELKDERIKSHGWETGRVRDIEIRKDGMIVGYYYYTLATRHRGMRFGSQDGYGIKDKNSLR